MRNLFSALTMLLLLLAMAQQSAAQTFHSSLGPDSSYSNEFSVNYSKLRNIGTFGVNGNYRGPLWGGIMQVNQNYTGSTITAGILSFRDNQDLRWNYFYPVFDDLSVGVANNWLLNSDSKNIGVNDQSRLNLSSGIRYDFFPRSFITALAGMESNKQLGITASGLYLASEGILRDYTFDEVLINAYTEGEYYRLSDDRSNYDLAINTAVTRDFDSDNHLSVDLRYNSQNRDLINPTINQQESARLIFESRTDNIYGIGLDLRLPLAESLIADFEAGFSNRRIGRVYNSFVSDNSLTGVRKYLDEQELNARGTLEYRNSFSSSLVSYITGSRSEENLLENRYGVDQQEFSRLRNIEIQRDNNTLKNSLNFSSRIFLPGGDTIGADAGISLLRYDTPGSQNNDDRDEQFIVGNLFYFRRFSQILGLKLGFDFYQNHLVYLRSQRSSQNNITRSIKFYPKVILQTGTLYYTPSFEVLANFTTYDFEYLNPAIRSFSFRQVAYRDTISVRIGTASVISGLNTVRYFERGLFYEDDFSETPQSSYLEIFNKLLYIYEPEENLYFGLGYRFYKLEQSLLTQIQTSSAGLNIEQTSVGPEIYMSFDFARSRISVTGWYEFMHSKGRLVGTIPNIFISTSVYF